MDSKSQELRKIVIPVTVILIVATLFRNYVFFLGAIISTPVYLASIVVIPILLILAVSKIIPYYNKNRDASWKDSTFRILTGFVFLSLGLAFYIANSISQVGV